MCKMFYYFECGLECGKLVVEFFGVVYLEGRGKFSSIFVEVFLVVGYISNGVGNVFVFFVLQMGKLGFEEGFGCYDFWYVNGLYV